MATSPIYSLVYLSRAKRAMSSQELDGLLVKARDINATLNITGMLLYHSGAFMQILEGPKDAVTELFYEKIIKDERHHKVVVTTKGFAPRRQFSGWRMSFENLDGRGEIRPDGFSSFIPDGSAEGLVPDHADRTVQILNNFRKAFGTPTNSDATP